MSTITKLQTSLNDLKNKLQFSPTSQPSQVPQASLTRATGKASSNYQNIRNDERKFNIVPYGIAENPQNTNRQVRMKKDMENIMEALCATDIDIEPSDIKDLYRLGKYDHKRACPRPTVS